MPYHAISNSMLIILLSLLTGWRILILKEAIAEKGLRVNAGKTKVCAVCTASTAITGCIFGVVVSL